MVVEQAALAKRSCVVLRIHPANSALNTEGRVKHHAAQETRDRNVHLAQTVRAVPRKPPPQDTVYIRTSASLVQYHKQTVRFKIYWTYMTIWRIEEVNESGFAEERRSFWSTIGIDSCLLPQALVHLPVEEEFAEFLARPREIE